MHGIFVQKGHDFEGDLGTIIRTQKGPKKRGPKKGPNRTSQKVPFWGQPRNHRNTPKITQNYRNRKLQEITGRSKVGLLRVVWRSVWPGPVQHLCRNGEACRSISYTNYRNRPKRVWRRPRIWGFGQKPLRNNSKMVSTCPNRWRQMDLFFGPKKGPFLALLLFLGPPV